QVEWDLRSGDLAHLQIEAGKSPDGATTRQQGRRGPGALRIADLGDFNLDVFGEKNQADEDFLSRLQHRAGLRKTAGPPGALAEGVAQETGVLLDEPMLIGDAKRLPCRVIAWRLPPEQAARRRQKLRHEYKDTYGTQPSKQRLALCDWTILITNVPPALLSTK